MFVNSSEIPRKQRVVPSILPLSPKDERGFSPELLPSDEAVQAHQAFQLEILPRLRLGKEISFHEFLSTRTRTENNPSSGSTISESSRTNKSGLCCISSDEVHNPKLSNTEVGFSWKLYIFCDVTLTFVSSDGEFHHGRQNTFLVRQHVTKLVHLSFEDWKHDDTNN